MSERAQADVVTSSACNCNTMALNDAQNHAMRAALRGLTLFAAQAAARLNCKAGLMQLGVWNTQRAALFMHHAAVITARAGVMTVCACKHDHHHWTGCVCVHRQQPLPLLCSLRPCATRWCCRRHQQSCCHPAACWQPCHAAARSWLQLLQHHGPCRCAAAACGHAVRCCCCCLAPASTARPRTRTA